MIKLSAKKIDFSIWALILICIVVLYSDFNNSLWNDNNALITHDVLPFYAYLPATFIHHDLTLEFLKEDREKLGKNFWGKQGPLGKTVITASCGMSILYSPFFFIANEVVKLTEFKADGYSIPYRIALVISSFFYLMMGAVFLRKFLLKYYSSTVVSITILTIVLATNLYWYTTVEAAMSHVYSFALISIFIYIIDRWFEKSTIFYTILIGLLIGIISLVRPSNLVIVFLLLLWKISNWKDLVARIQFFLKKWHLVIIMLVMFFAVWTPQMLYWKYVTGNYLYYSYPDSQGFFFLNPQFFGTLFSWRKGFLIYTPVMIFAIIGLGLLYKKKNRLFWPIAVYTLINWYIISSWWDWWYGGSLGLRPLIDSYGIFAIGLATFLTWAFKTTWLKKTIVLSIFFLTVVLSSWHHHRYYKGSIHWVAMTKEAYFNSFWRATPAPNFYEKIRFPDYKLARKGIYKYEDESQDIPSE